MAKWKNAEACYDMLQFGLRLGARPVQLLTTTPKPVPLIRRLMAGDDVTVTRMRTGDNAANLSARFIQALERNYAGTRLGRQELDGELIEDREDALWTRAGLEAATAPRGTGGAEADRRGGRPARFEPPHLGCLRHRRGGARRGRRCAGAA